jgi:hypothetical protein
MVPTKDWLESGWISLRIAGLKYPLSSQRKSLSCTRTFIPQVININNCYSRRHRFYSSLEGGAAVTTPLADAGIILHIFNLGEPVWIYRLLSGSPGPLHRDCVELLCLSVTPPSPNQLRRCASFVGERLTAKVLARHCILHCTCIYTCDQAPYSSIDT